MQLLSPPTPTQRNARAGFSLVELVIVLLVTATLIGIVAPKVQSQGAKARDARRVQDLRVWVEAIEQYKLDKGDYPDHGSLVSGWDRSSNGDFIPVLVNEGYTRSPLADPSENASYYFVYRRFARGNHGCVGPGNFYVIGIRSFESGDSVGKFPSEFRCAQRDFGQDLDFVTGGGANFQ